MNLEILNPLEYSEWDKALLASGDNCFFHSSAWARVLHESYRFRPVYFASFEKGKLSCLMPFMEVNSWLTGRRGVSLPFTDYCPQLVPDRGAFQGTVKALFDFGARAGWKYVEWRDGEYFPEEVKSSDRYHTHELNLTKTEKELFSGLRDSTRRNIRKAARAGVVIEIHDTRESIDCFYRLHCITRKRHGLPPQPAAFFKKISEHIVSKGQGIVVLALHEGNAVASAVFFHFGNEGLYKYGASDLVYQDLRPNNLLMWHAIKWYRDHGFQVLNFGRTEPKNNGLLQFKRGWGAEERTLKYYRYDLRKKGFVSASARLPGVHTQVLAKMPSPLLRLLGSLLYRHLA